MGKTPYLHPIAKSQITMKPKRNVLATRLKKSPETPLKALPAPAKKQVTNRIRLAPYRSASIPPTRRANNPARWGVPHTTPISTGLRLNSSDISLNRTDTHICGMAKARQRDATTRPSTYHLFVRLVRPKYSAWMNYPVGHHVRLEDQNKYQNSYQKNLFELKLLLETSVRSYP